MQRSFGESFWIWRSSISILLIVHLAVTKYISALRPTVIAELALPAALAYSAPPLSVLGIVVLMTENQDAYAEVKWTIDHCVRKAMQRETAPLLNGRRAKL